MVTFIVGSAGAVDGNNVSLYVEQFKTITAWDTAGVKTLKNGVGYTNFYDVKGNLICQKNFISGINTNMLGSYKVFYTNQQLSFLYPQILILQTNHTLNNENI